MTAGGPPGRGHRMFNASRWKPTRINTTVNRWKSENVDGWRQEIDDYRRKLSEIDGNHWKIGEISCQGLPQSRVIEKLLKLGAKGCPTGGTIHSDLRTSHRDDASYVRFLVNLSKLLGAKGCPRGGTIHSDLRTAHRDDASYARFLEILVSYDNLVS